ncbi:ankyrin repeat domain-containing protein [Parashewanella curva]|uniref:Ankyrin repeat domain-containing protein n=1 Tax=Parashewanella curva TaxID=2338552 RepID=A0A3L8PR15_9GAMM|nr:ankyrin repeat domain-containing protein [Parashewanella curva]RLV57795.1 ankyrin repeat domain-containing protein [Parashewanella curva]
MAEGIHPTSLSGSNLDSLSLIGKAETNTRFNLKNHQTFLVSLTPGSLAAHDVFFKFIQQHLCSISVNNLMIAHEYNIETSNTPDDNNTLTVSGLPIDAALIEAIDNAKAQGNRLLDADIFAKNDYSNRLDKLLVYLVEKIIELEITEKEALKFIQAFQQRIVEIDQWQKPMQLRHIGGFPMPVDEGDEWACLSGLYIRFNQFAQNDETNAYKLQLNKWLDDAFIHLSPYMTDGSEVHLVSAIKWVLLGREIENDVHYRLPIHDLVAKDLFDLLTNVAAKYTTPLQMSLELYIQQIEQMMELKQRFYNEETYDENLTSEFSQLQQKLEKDPWTLTLNIPLSKKIVAGDFDLSGAARKHISNLSKRQMEHLLPASRLPLDDFHYLDECTKHPMKLVMDLIDKNYKALAALVTLCMPTVDFRPFLLIELQTSLFNFKNMSLLSFLESQCKESLFVSNWLPFITERLEVCEGHTADCMLLKKFVLGREDAWDEVEETHKEVFLIECINNGASYSIIKRLIEKLHNKNNHFMIKDINWSAWIASEQLVPLLVLLKGHVDLNEVLSTLPSNYFDEGQLIHIASEYKLPELMAYLLAQEGIEVNRLTSNGESALFLCCNEQFEEGVSQLLGYQLEHPNSDTKLDLIDSETECTPLQIACHNRDIEIVRHFLTFYEQRPRKESILWHELEVTSTLLHAACFTGSTWVVRDFSTVLIQNPELIDALYQEDKEDNCTVLHLACQQEQYELVDEILSLSPKFHQMKKLFFYEHKTTLFTPFHQAINLGSLDIVQAFIALYTRDPSIKALFTLKHSESQDTPLQTACSLGHAEIVRELLVFYSKHQILNEVLTLESLESKPSSFYVACHEGYVNIIGEFLDLVDLQNPTIQKYIFGRNKTTQLTPLLAALVNGHVKVMTIFLAITDKHPNLANYNPTKDRF